MQENQNLKTNEFLTLLCTFYILHEIKNGRKKETLLGITITVLTQIGNCDFWTPYLNNKQSNFCL